MRPHEGDPCVHCGIPHDEVPVGSCPGCPECGGRGYYPEPHGPEDPWGVQDVRERYCSCPAGKRLKEAE